MFESVTTTGLVATGSQVATEFGGVIGIVLAVSFGVFAVGYGVRLIAKRGK